MGNGIWWAFLRRGGQLSARRRRRMNLISRPVPTITEAPTTGTTTVDTGQGSVPAPGGAKNCQSSGLICPAAAAPLVMECRISRII